LTNYGLSNSIHQLLYRGGALSAFFNFLVMNGNNPA
jgi:hypothetical protein